MCICDWKIAYVTPIFKKGSKMTPSNYRPVSLTCKTCKVMEKIVLDHMINHLLKNSLISKEQHGFVPGRSCVTQLLEVMDIWSEILDEGGSMDVIYTDFENAFDMAYQASQKDLHLGLQSPPLDQ